jgi:hypothetical protein
MHTWRAFWRLDPADRWLAVETAALMTGTRLVLRIVGFRRWKTRLVRRVVRKVSPANEAEQIAAARKIARIQQAVLRHLTWHASCLERSVALWWQLNRRGIAAEMRAGARKEAGRFEAHAWVEVGNVILNDSGETHQHFAPFDGSILSLET